MSLLRACALLLTAGAPLVAVSQPQGPVFTIRGRLALHRSGIVAVGDVKGYRTLVSEPSIRARLEGVLTESVKAGGPECELLGMDRPGVYFLSRNGRVLRFAPSLDTVEKWIEILDSLGWISAFDRLGLFLRENPERLDIHWQRAELSTHALGRNPNTPAIAQCAQSWRDLLEQPGWAQIPNVFQAPTPAPESKEAREVLASLAKTHWSAVEREVRRSPQHLPTWRVIGQFAQWNPDAPKLYLLLLDVPPPPDMDASIGDWPTVQAVQLAEDQLRRQEDWSGLFEFARRRIEIIDSTTAARDAPAQSEWSGTLIIHQDGKVVRPTRGDAQASLMGKWLSLAIEGCLRCGKPSEAQSLAIRLQAEGDLPSLRRIYFLAEALGQDSLVTQIRPHLSLESQPH